MGRFRVVVGVAVAATLVLGGCGGMTTSGGAAGGGVAEGGAAMGMGWFERRDEPHTPFERRITPAFKGETGIDLHYRAASLRGFLFALPLLPSAFNDRPIAGFGFQLGVLL